MRVRPSLDWIDLAGPIAAVVFAPRRSRLDVRAKYRDPAPSLKQLAVRAGFVAADLAWQVLSPANKVLWRQWKPWYALTGYMLFMRCNIPLAIAGLPLYVTPPDYPPWV